MTEPPNQPSKAFVVEHLDPELGPWSALEYLAIAKECAEAGVTFCVSSIADERIVPRELHGIKGVRVESQSVEELYGRDKGRVCLLDPAALAELSPDDEDRFDVFLFGGILGNSKP